MRGTKINWIQRSERSKDAIEVDSTGVETISSSAGTFLCPISYDDETDPAILVVERRNHYFTRLDRRQ
jgi:hypothetical protein